MLIIFLGSQSEQLRSYFSDSDKTPLLIAQAGVYELAEIINKFPRAKLFVIQRDLEAAGLISTFKNNPKVSMIDFEEFVSLTIKHSPCITVQ